ncbi:GIY-YIG nuclease family protein [Pradoshia sp.]
MIINWQTPPDDHIYYSIFLWIEKDCEAEIGKLGIYSFRRGVYVYIGSAKRNLVKRIERHLCIEKKKRWHMDYIRPFGTIVKIITYDDSLGECELAGKFIAKGEVPVPRMGASDCKCPSHFIYLGNPKLPLSDDYIKSFFQ